MQVFLEVARARANLKRVLIRSKTVIGRGVGCNLRIASKEVSRKHCEVTVNDDTVLIRDLGSSNGTFVNGYPLESDQEYTIAPDSELSLGGVKFFVRFTPPAEEAAAQGPGSTVDFREDDADAGVATQRLDVVDPTESMQPESLNTVGEPHAFEQSEEPEPTIQAKSLHEAAGEPPLPARDEPATSEEMPRESSTTERADSSPMETMEIPGFGADSDFDIDSAVAAEQQGSGEETFDDEFEIHDAEDADEEPDPDAIQLQQPAVDFSANPDAVGTDDFFEVADDALSEGFSGDAVEDPLGDVLDGVDPPEIPEENIADAEDDDLDGFLQNLP